MWNVIWLIWWFDCFEVSVLTVHNKLFMPGSNILACGRSFSSPFVIHLTMRFKRAPCGFTFETTSSNVSLWLMVGEFNSILTEDERIGKAKISYPNETFRTIWKPINCRKCCTKVAILLGQTGSSDWGIPLFYPLGFTVPPCMFPQLSEEFYYICPPCSLIACVDKSLCSIFYLILENSWSAIQRWVRSDVLAKKEVQGISENVQGCKKEVTSICTGSHAYVHDHANLLKVAKKLNSCMSMDINQP